MDLNDVRIAVTVISLLAFLVIVMSTMKGSRRSEFEEAARLPFADEKSGEDRS
ncbi:MAG: cbb3-type cytochrome c oxidase subunit 3 [Betaproteobacteria bacterium]